jgi:prepilin-type N-terminal cleavage/methylation domain-containing protein/prepilin-type processing-associated H-X9-DG protein
MTNPNDVMRSHDKRSRTTWRSGFTLVEILVSIAIIAILATIVLLLSKRLIQSARTSTCLSNLRQLAAVVTQQAAEQGFYPAVISQSTSSTGAVQNNGDHLGRLIDELPCVSCPAAKYTGTTNRGWPVSAYGSNPMVMGNTQNSTPPLVRTAQIQRPSEVILMADGAQFGPQNPRALGFSFRWFGEKSGNPNNSGKPLTTADIPQGGFWDPEVATLPLRHNGKANVVFCDGHAETISSYGELKEKNLYRNY